MSEEDAMNSVMTDVPVNGPGPVTVAEFEAAVAAKEGHVDATQEALAQLEQEARDLAVAGESTASVRDLIRRSEDDLQDLRVQAEALRAGLAEAEAAATARELDRDVRAFYGALSNALQARGEVLAVQELLAERVIEFGAVLREEAERLRPGIGPVVDRPPAPAAIEFPSRLLRQWRTAVTRDLVKRGAVLVSPGGVLNDGGSTSAEVFAEADRFATLAGGAR